MHAFCEQFLAAELVSGHAAALTLQFDQMRIDGMPAAEPTERDESAPPASSTPAKNPT